MRNGHEQPTGKKGKYLKRGQKCRTLARKGKRTPAIGKRGRQKRNGEMANGQPRKAG